MLRDVVVPVPDPLSSKSLQEDTQASGGFFGEIGVSKHPVGARKVGVPKRPGAGNKDAAPEVAGGTKATGEIAAQEMVRVKVKVSDAEIEDLKARPQDSYRDPLEGLLEFLTPEKREQWLDEFAKLMAAMDEERAKEIAILDEYNRTGSAYEVVEIEEGELKRVLRKYRKWGYDFEVLD